MKTAFAIFACCLSVMCAPAQSIVGSWQLIKQSNCMEDQLGTNDADGLVTEMKQMASPTPQVMKLKENNSGEESTKIITSKKSYNSKSFLYKFDGTSIYFLDKKSHTIIETFSVERLKSDSLILTNTARACETKIFVRIK